MNIYLLLLTSSILAIVGQLSFKFGAAGGTLSKVLWSPWLWSGLASYFVSMVLWIYSLTKVRLGVAYAFTTLTFVGVYLATFIILKEPVTAPKIAAIGLIITGFLMLAKWG